MITPRHYHAVYIPPAIAPTTQPGAAFLVFFTLWVLAGTDSGMIARYLLPILTGLPVL